LDFDGSTLTVTGDISNTGDLTVAGTIYETSAERFKTNIQPAGNQLEKVLKLNGVTFEKLNNYNRKEIGLIAEDVGEIYPEFVSPNSEAVNYGKMVAVLVEAIKELNEKIEKLEKGN
jgi:5-enolpyruvylshikimate-3-phosphate synthase